MLDRSSAPPVLSNVPMDALSEVLQDFRLSGVSYGRCELSHPWGIEFPAEQVLRFHFVGSGPCWLFTHDKGWQELNAGDLILLPQGAAHKLASSPDAPCGALSSCQITQLGGDVRNFVGGGEGARTTLFFGSMVLGALAMHPLLALMPTMVRGCDVAATDQIMRPLLDAMTAEAAQPRMGGATILSRMADLLTARLIRCWVNCTPSATTGWLAAVRDPHIGRAIAAIHRDPGHAWTLDGLARVAGQSRSVFAERFAALLGEGAARYLTRWRMQLAREWLAAADAKVADVAFRLGYDSESSFARAFKRTLGQTPGAARRLESRTNG